MRFTCFRSQRNATGIFSKSEAALEQPRKVCAARLSRRKPKPPTEQARKNMRRCSERAARLFRQKPKFRLTSRESMCAAVPNALPVCFVGNQPFRSNSPRESARGCEPSRTPSPRGIGERSAPRPRRRKPKFPPEQPHGFVGGRNLRPNRRGRTCAAAPKAPPACSVRNQNFVCAPVARGGVGERRAPRLRPRKPKFPPEQPHGFVEGRNLRPNRHEKYAPLFKTRRPPVSSETNVSGRTSPGERERM